MGKVSRLYPPTEKGRNAGVEITVLLAEWNGGYANLSAVIREMASPSRLTAQYVQSQPTPGAVRGGVYYPQIPGGSSVAYDALTGRATPQTGGGPDPFGTKAKDVLTPGQPGVVVRWTLILGPPYTMSSGTTFYLEHGSLRWMAERRDEEAQYRLAVMCHRGEGVPQDYAQAAKWFGRAAEQGLAKAQNNLGLLYARGQGVPQDYVTSYMWFTLAAPSKPDKNQANLKLLESRMTAEQIAEGKRRAEEWLKQHPPSH